METLHNNIKLPAQWPPESIDETTLEPLPVPYLDNPPDVIKIDTGRQLFVDDFLIEESDLERRFHKAEFHPDSPVLKPETPLEINGGLAPMAAPFKDGCWYDPEDKLFKLWYYAGWFSGIKEGTCLAVSEDGIHYYRKNLNVIPGTNQVILPPTGWRRDGSVTWLDHETKDPLQRWKMFHFYRTPEGERAEVRTSHDGIHWSNPRQTGLCGDNTSFFYNPFRRKWVFSIRSKIKSHDRFIRARRYYECDDFFDECDWETGEDVFWQRCDTDDCRYCQPDVCYPPKLQPQLYDLNCVAYESVMLGIFSVLKGFDEADNKVHAHSGYPKHVDLHIGFSRDGFHFSRYDRQPFIACTRSYGDWNMGYLHPAGGICLVVGDKLLFPVSGWSGKSPMNGRYLYGGASMGIAELRRDGFVSLNANWTLQSVTTRLVKFDSGKKLFVNADADEGYIMCEILDREGKPIKGYTLDDCIPAQSDSTKQQVRWIGTDLTPLKGKPVRFKFYLISSALYSFWVSPDEQGKSGGYLAAGGPGYAGIRDI